MKFCLRIAATSWLFTAVAGLLSFGQIFPLPAPDSVAQVTELQGQVSVLRDSSPWALSVGDTVQVKQMIITGPDGYAVFRVSDGSTFDVFPNSRLTFRNNPSNLRDLLDLWMGRVKVQIQRLGGQANPNRIHTPTAVISVRGTVFDVVVEDEDDTTLVAVEEGQVIVQHALLPRNDPKILNPGEWLRIYKNQPLSARNGVDKSAIAKFALRALQEAMYTILTRTPRTPGGGPIPGGGGGTTLPGDTGSTPPPPPSTPGSDAPATAPPPPPGGGN